MRRALAGGALALSLAACSGAPWTTRTVSESGEDITFDERLFRDVEALLRACAPSVVVEGGADRIDGSSILLANCFNRVTRQVDMQAALAGAPDEARMRALITVIRFIDQPLPEPIPVTVFRDTDRSQLRLLSVLLPALEQQIDSQGELPGFIRESLKETLRALLATSQCEYTQNVAVKLRALRLTNVRLSWERALGNHRLLRLKADLGEALPQADAEIDTEVKCFGSTRNPANDLLSAAVPDGPHAVTLTGGRLSVDFAIAVKQDPDTRRGAIEMKLEDFDFTVGGVTIERFGSQPADKILDDAIAKLDMTPARLSRIASSHLRKPLVRLAPTLGDFLLRSLDIDDPDDVRKLAIVGVEADDSAGPGAHTMRFVTMRTDKVCFFRPGGRIVDGRFTPGEGEMVCVDPTPPPADKGVCVTLPNGRVVCFPSPPG